MATITHKEIMLKLEGNVPTVGQLAPDFTGVLSDLKEVSLYQSTAKVKVLLPLPSLDTGTCAKETRRFNELLDQRPNLAAWVISMDLPFAMRRFCELEGIKNVTALSDFRSKEFGAKYGMFIAEGAMRGLHARAVFVLDQDNVIRHIELVEDLGAEPNYEAALKAIDALM
ncbi:MAG TPA: thiol peroxidase [Luteibaculaceae bacterium]|nr:thiol peroxidase [Luteibaculaceae bacterium]